eukprot:3081855-Rhodomonas_salina.2
MRQVESIPENTKPRLRRRKVLDAVSPLAASHLREMSPRTMMARWLYAREQRATVLMHTGGWHETAAACVRAARVDVTRAAEYQDATRFRTTGLPVTVSVAVAEIEILPCRGNSPRICLTLVELTAPFSATLWEDVGPSAEGWEPWNEPRCSTVVRAGNLCKGAIWNASTERYTAALYTTHPNMGSAPMWDIGQDFCVATTAG